MALQAFSADLPRPPSANRLWRIAGRNVVKSAEYIGWLHGSGYLITVKSKNEAFEGGYVLRILAGRKGKVHFDIDNYCKPINDLLAFAKLVENDKLCQRVSAEWDVEIPADQVRIVVTATSTRGAA